MVILFTSLFFVTTPVFAKTFFPTISTVVESPPTYCVVQPPFDTAPEHMVEGYIGRFIEAVADWKNKLMAEDPDRRNNWLLKAKVVSERNIKNDDECDIPVRLLSGWSEEAVGRYCYAQSYLYNPETCSNPPIPGFPWIQMYVMSWNEYRTNDKFFGTAKHEIGHSLGLGHFSSDDNEQNKKWVTTEPSPSIMVTPSHKIPNLRTITSLDVEKVRSIYGVLGFFAFAPTPTPIPTPTPTPLPTPTPIPTPKPIPTAYNLFDNIEISGEYQIVRPTRSYETIMLKISGLISESVFARGNSVYLLVISPAQTFTLELIPTKDGYFETPFVIDKHSPIGTYRIQGMYLEKQQPDTDIFFEVVENPSSIMTAREILSQRDSGKSAAPKTPSIEEPKEEKISHEELSQLHSYIALLESELPEIEQRMSDVEKQVEETNQNEYTSPKAKKLLKTLNSEYFKVKLELENIDSDWIGIDELYDKSWDEQYSTRESFELAYKMIHEIDSETAKIKNSMNFISSKIPEVEKTQTQFDDDVKDYESSKEKFCFLFWCW